MVEVCSFIGDFFNRLNSCPTWSLGICPVCLPLLLIVFFACIEVWLWERATLNTTGTRRMTLLCSSQHHHSHQDSRLHRLHPHRQLVGGESNVSTVGNTM